MIDRRHASLNKTARSASKSRLTSMSQESQLAHDFRVHANVASSSSTSLGRHGQSSMSLHEQSNMNLHDLPPVPSRYLHSDSPDMFLTQQGSAPTSPYGHPKGTAVAMGQGIGRGLSQELPPISDWEGQDINPMFRVVSFAYDKADRPATST
jgi:meiosis induction protein kinase IME2/SME1